MVKKSLMIINVCATLFFVGCNTKKEEAVASEEFKITSPLVQDTLINKNYVAQIRSINHIELRAQERGYLEKIYVDEGQSVKKGQLLFKIMPNLYQTDVNRAQAEARYAEIEYKNAKSLADKDIVAPQEMSMAKAKLDKARAEVAEMNTHLQFTDIRAPFDGIIGRFHVRKGSLVDDGDLMTELSDNSKMWVYFNVPEAEYLNQMYNKGDNNFLHVKLQLANEQMYDQDGIVETIESDFNNETGNIAYRATFLNPNKILRYGQTGNILITTPYPNALMIPQKSTFEVLEKKYVYVVDKNNVAKAREIKVAAELPHIYVVSSGLNKGDRILLEGLRKVQNNQKIATKYFQPKKVMSDLDLYSE